MNLRIPSFILAGSLLASCGVLGLGESKELVYVVETEGGA